MSVLDSPRPAKRAKITDAFLPTPERSSQPSQAITKTPTNVASSNPPSSSTGRLFRHTNQAKRRGRQQFTASAVPLSSYNKLTQTFDDSESETNSQTPTPENATQAGSKVAHFSSKNINGSDSDDAPTPSRLQKSHSNESINEIDLVSDDEDVLPTPRLWRRSSQVGVNEKTSDEDAPSAESTPQRSSQKIPLKLSKQAQQDLDEDVKDLRSSSPPVTVRPSQSSARNAALAAYKKNREKQQRKASVTNGKLEKSRRVIIDDDDDDDDDEGENNKAAPADDDPIYADAEQQEDLYYDEDENNDFIIEDNEDGEYTPSALPLEWKLQSAKPAQLFEYVIEWMVQKRLNPAFRSEDAVYDIAFRKVDDFAKYMGGSKFQSSAWTSEFARALKTRPDLDETRFSNSGFDHDRCDACNRSGHPATFECQFKGLPYDRETLEDITDDEEDITRDAELAPEDRVFYIGKFCMRNARTAHALAHWRRHLNEWVVEWLESQRYLTDKAIVKRDRWTTEKRRKFANEVVDRMKETGEVKQLYKTFKLQLETAQNQSVSLARPEASILDADIAQQFTRYSSP